MGRSRSQPLRGCGNGMTSAGRHRSRGRGAPDLAASVVLDGSRHADQHHRRASGSRPRAVSAILVTQPSQAREPGRASPTRARDDLPRRARAGTGAPRTVSDAQVEEVVAKTLEETPRGETYWSRRSMARAVGLSADTIGRIWQTFGLKPHLTERFKLSSDPQLHRQGARHRGPLLEPAGERGRDVGR